MKVAWYKFILLFVFSGYLFSCISQSVKLNDMDYSVSDIKRAIVGISGDPRKVLQGDREFLSSYFSKETVETHSDLAKIQERFYASFLIIGDRRPYNIVVVVYAEVKENGRFVDNGIDEPLTKKIAKELRDKLNQGRNSRNVIDDFRPF